MISECSKLAQKNIRLDTTGWKGDPLENVQEIEIRPYNKWYMHNPAPVQENNTHKLLWDVHTDNLISARRPNQIIINNNNKKRICKICCAG